MALMDKRVILGYRLVRMYSSAAVMPQPKDTPDQQYFDGESIRMANVSRRNSLPPFLKSQMFIIVYFFSGHCWRSSLNRYPPPLIIFIVFPSD